MPELSPCQVTSQVTHGHPCYCFTQKSLCPPSPPPPLASLAGPAGHARQGDSKSGCVFHGHATCWARGHLPSLSALAQLRLILTDQAS